MRCMQQQLGVLRTISAFAYRHRETKKNLCLGGRSQDLPDTDFQQTIQQRIRLHCSYSFISIQPWRPEPSHVTGMALAHCILDKFLGVVCHCFPPSLDVPTLAARCLRPQRRERSQQRKVELWARKMSGSKFRDLLHAANLRHGTDGFTFFSP